MIEIHISLPAHDPRIGALLAALSATTRPEVVVNANAKGTDKPVAVTALPSPTVTPPATDQPPKRGRGRPRKNPLPAAEPQPAAQPTPAPPPTPATGEDLFGTQAEGAATPPKPVELTLQTLRTLVQETLAAIGPEATRAVFDKFKVSRLPEMPTTMFAPFAAALAEARKMVS